MAHRFFGQLPYRPWLIFGLVTVSGLLLISSGRWLIDSSGSCCTGPGWFLDWYQFLVLLLLGFFWLFGLLALLIGPDLVWADLLACVLAWSYWRFWFGPLCIFPIFPACLIPARCWLYHCFSFVVIFWQVAYGFWFDIGWLLFGQLLCRPWLIFGL